MPRILFNRWAKSSSFTTSEIELLERLLLHESPESRKLLKQAQQPPYVVRNTVGNAGYEARIPYLGDNSLLVEADCDIESPTVEITDSQSGRQLRFSTVILRGGFLFGLRGLAVDGRAWPRTWRAGSEIKLPDEVFTWLDALKSPLDAEAMSAALKDLVKWSGADWDRFSDQQRACLRLAPPSSDAQIAQCAARLRTSLPDQYVQFVKITNGFGIQRGRTYEVLGTNDIDYFDESRLWIGITPLYEDGYVALRNKDGSVNCYLLSPDGRANIIGDLRQHVRESLEWEGADQ